MSNVVMFIFTLCIIGGITLMVIYSPTTKTGNVTNIVGNNLTLQFQNTNSQKIPQCTVSATESCYPKSTYTIQVENPQDYTLNQSIEVYYYKFMDSSNVYLTPVYRSYLILGSIIFVTPCLTCLLVLFGQSCIDYSRVRWTHYTSFIPFFGGHKYMYDDYTYKKVDDSPNYINPKDRGGLPYSIEN